MLYHLIKIKYIKLFIGCINIQSMVFTGYLNIIFVKNNLICIIYLCGGTKMMHTFLYYRAKILNDNKKEMHKCLQQFYDKTG